MRDKCVGCDKSCSSKHANVTHLFQFHAFYIKTTIFNLISKHKQEELKETEILLPSSPNQMDNSFPFYFQCGDHFTCNF